jgi:hypothetical protein
MTGSDPGASSRHLDIVPKKTHTQLYRLRVDPSYQSEIFAESTSYTSRVCNSGMSAPAVFSSVADSLKEPVSPYQVDFAQDDPGLIKCIALRILSK